jgi:hypothetical protein
MGRVHAFLVSVLCVSLFVFFSFFLLFGRVGCIAWDDTLPFPLGLILVQTERVHISPILAQN